MKPSFQGDYELHTHGHFSSAPPAFHQEIQAP